MLQTKSPRRPALPPRLVLPLTLPLLLVSATSFAGPGDGNSEPAGVGPDYVSVPGGSSIIYVPEDLREGNDDGPMRPRAKPGTTFLNFDGASLSSGNDDARQNRTQIGELAGSYPAFSGSANTRAAVIDAVMADWAPYANLITTTRPTSGEYNMIMIGPKNQPFGNGVLGIAPLDCNDNNPYNITYSFSGGQYGANTDATTISQEVAHGFGLEHVNSASDIMNPYNQGGNPAFLDQCIALVSGSSGGIYCNSQHQQFCNSGSQNSHQELLNLFGPSTPDNQAPTGQITFPSDGQSFPIGSSFAVMVDANDDVGVKNVELYNGGDMLAVDASAPYAFDIVNIPAGTYSFQATVQDNAGNSISTNTVTITVSDDGGSTSGTTTGSTTDGSTESTGGESTGDGGSGSATDGGGVDDGGLDSGTDDGLFPPGFGNEEDDSGCACTADSKGSTGAWFGLLLLVPLLRRRRAA